MMFSFFFIVTVIIKESETSEGVRRRASLDEKEGTAHSVKTAWDKIKDKDNNNHRDSGGKGSRVTAFPHPPAQGKWDVLVWDLRCGTRYESCTGALSAQCSGLKPGKITSVNIVHSTHPTNNALDTERWDEILIYAAHCHTFLFSFFLFIKAGFKTCHLPKGPGLSLQTYVGNQSSNTHLRLTMWGGVGRRHPARYSKSKKCVGFGSNTSSHALKKSAWLWLCNHKTENRKSLLVGGSNHMTVEHGHDQVGRHHTSS